MRGTVKRGHSPGVGGCVPPCVWTAVGTAASRSAVAAIVPRRINTLNPICIRVPQETGFDFSTRHRKPNPVSFFLKNRAAR
jgi:hypothetical protein